MSYLTLDGSVLIYYLIDFVIVLLLLAGLRFFSGLLANASLNEILSEHDNFAVGISLSGAVIGLAIVLMGAVSGQASGSPQEELILMTSYGLLGVVLMWLTRLIFDYISFPEISIHQQIFDNNAAIGLVDAGNMIASAIIVRAVMLWVEGGNLQGLGVVLFGFLASQVLMYLATLYRRLVFSRRHPDSSLPQELADGNVALAIRFSGHRIGVALAVTATSGLLVYQADKLGFVLALWLLIALVLFAVQTLFAFIIRHVLLPGVNVGVEVTEQRNVAIGSLEAAIYIAVGFVFVGLLG